MNIKEHLEFIRQNVQFPENHIKYLYKLKKMDLNQKLYMILVVVSYNGPIL